MVYHIKKLISYNFKVRIAFTATTINCTDIFNTYLLCNQLNVTTMSISPVFPLRKGKKFEFNDIEYLSQVLKCKEHEKISKTKIRVQFTQYFQYVVHKYLKSINNLEYFSRKDDLIYYQSEGILSLQVDAKGNVIPGPEWENEILLGNLYEDGFNNICKKAIDSILYQGRNFYGTKCEKCNVFSLCRGGNSKLAYQSYKTINMPDGSCLVDI